MFLQASGCIAYLGPFTASYRAELIDDWVAFCIKNHIPVDPRFDLVDFLFVL